MDYLAKHPIVIKIDTKQEASFQDVIDISLLQLFNNMWKQESPFQYINTIDVIYFDIILIFYEPLKNFNFAPFFKNTFCFIVSNKPM